MATGTIWLLPNYTGELYTASKLQTPFLSMIGTNLQSMGNAEGGYTTTNFQFPTNQNYTIPAASQPDISEDDSLTAPAANNFARDQYTNVVQIFQETVDLSYVKTSNYGRMSGVYEAGQDNPLEDEKAFQIQVSLQKIARDMEYSWLNGTYQLSTGSSVSNKTRGIIPSITTNATDALTAQLDKTLMDQAMREGYDNGAVFKDMVIYVNSYQKQAISSIYGYAPDDRYVGGLNIKQIETDFGVVGIVLDPFVPQDTVLFAEYSECASYFQPVPGKGNFFYEELGKDGASEKGQIFGQAGLDHSAEFLHIKITNLATS